MGRHKSFVLPQRFMNPSPLLLWSEIREEREPSYVFIAFLPLFISLMFASVTKKSTLWCRENTMKFQNGLAAVSSIYHGTKKCQTVECETLPQSAKRMDVALSSGSLPLRSFVFGQPDSRGILKAYFVSAKTDCYVCRWHTYWWKI